MNSSTTRAIREFTYMLVGVAGRGHNTVAAYERDVTHCATWLYEKGRLPLEEASGAQVMDYMNDLAVRGYAATRERGEHRHCERFFLFCKMRSVMRAMRWRCCHRRWCAAACLMRCHWRK